MIGPAETELALPLILPVGDAALMVRFGSSLSQAANRAATRFARQLAEAPLAGVLEVVPNLVSVLLRYDPAHEDVARLAGELRLRLSRASAADQAPVTAGHRVPVRFGGSAGPDLDEVSAALGLAPGDFIAAHNASRLQVLATGFAPGFVYCGFHPEQLHLPRRTVVRPSVPIGSVLFAAGQTAITSTLLPTGWHVIGSTDLRNFDPCADPPTHLRAGDDIAFEVAP